MATQLAEAIRKSPQIEAAQDWKTVVNLNHGVTPSEASDLPYGRKITPVTLCNPLRSGRFFVACATQADGQAQSHALRVPLLVIPASAAFGTGGHATTAMSLRFLERLTREWGRWSVTGRSWDWERDSRPSGETVWRRTRDWH